MSKLLRPYFDTDHLVAEITPLELAAPKRMSPERIATLGWTRVPAGPCGPTYTHPAGGGWSTVVKTTAELALELVGGKG